MFIDHVERAQELHPKEKHHFNVFFTSVKSTVLDVALLDWNIANQMNCSIISDVTVLLSLTMFLHQVSDRMPKTSDAVPLISM